VQTMKWGKELRLKVLTLLIKRYGHFQPSRTSWEEKDFMKTLISFSLLQKVSKRYLPNYRSGLV